MILQKMGYYPSITRSTTSSSQDWRDMDLDHHVWCLLAILLALLLPRCASPHIIDCSHFNNLLRALFLFVYGTITFWNPNTETCVYRSLCHNADKIDFFFHVLIYEDEREPVCISIVMCLLIAIRSESWVCRYYFFQNNLSATRSISCWAYFYLFFKCKIYVLIAISLLPPHSSSYFQQALSCCPSLWKYIACPESAAWCPCYIWFTSRGLCCFCKHFISGCSCPKYCGILWWTGERASITIRWT